jgi:hypothetical protein
MGEEDRWAKLETIVRKVVREEIQALGKKPKINLMNGRFTGITENQMDAWSAAYPGVEIDQEIKRAAAWCVSNPASAPKSDFGRYLNSWLSREQNKVALRSIPATRPTETKVTLCGYCGRSSTGSVNGIPYCNDHSHDAMDMKPRRMLGVVAKPVAGRD